jgi:hypothetical protein
MFEPFTAWRSKGRSRVVRWVEVGDLKRTLWMIGFHGEKPPLLRKENKKKGFEGSRIQGGE